jgi:hypothetical protein
MDRHWAARRQVEAKRERVRQPMVEVVFAVVIVGCSSGGMLCDIEQPTGEKFVSLAACRSYAATYTAETQALRRLTQEHPDRVFTVICRRSRPNRQPPSTTGEDEQSPAPVR